MKLWLLLTCWLVLTSPQLAADEPTYRPLPWQLVNVSYDIGQYRDVSTIEVDYQLFDPMPDNGQGLFLVPLAMKVCGKECYAGACNRGFPVGSEGKYAALPEHGFIYTQFGTDSPLATKPANGSYSYLSDHEGPLANVSRPVVHKKGVYTLKLARRKPERGSSDKDAGRTVVDLTITCRADGSVVDVGGLVFESAQWALESSVGSFCEIVNGWDAKAKQWRKSKETSEADIPAMRYAVGNWRIDGERVTAKSIRAYYRTNVPQRAKVYMLDSCPLKDLKEAVDKALAKQDTLVYVVSDKAYTRTGDKVELREQEFIGGKKFDAVIEMLKK